MKRPGLKYIFLPAVMSLLLAGCRTSGTSRKSSSVSTDTHIETLRELSEVDNTSELTARVSFNLSGQKAGGQLRMRRDHSIQIGISLLGLVEVARIEFLPDKIVIMDRTSGRYALCHYADLPLRNELGLDFNVVQALLWNRIFSPGAANETEFLRNVVFSGTDGTDGSSVFREREYDYIFKVNADRHLTRTSRTDSGRGVSIGYSDFRTVSDGFVFPMAMNLALDDETISVSASFTLSSVSTAKGNWPDETGVGRRMTKVTLDELLQGLSL